MPKFNGQNKKRIDPRYFLHEQEHPPMANPAEDLPPTAGAEDEQESAELAPADKDS
jgi:hypothetical protein|tara:strand:+ start:1365 stop:1532 length:168 start_codon:yes stop_codon:yes gene_type:complete